MKDTVIEILLSSSAGSQFELPVSLYCQYSAESGEKLGLGSQDPRVQDPGVPS